MARLTVDSVRKYVADCGYSDLQVTKNKGYTLFLDIYRKIECKNLSGVMQAINDGLLLNPDEDQEEVVIAINATISESIANDESHDLGCYQLGVNEPDNSTFMGRIALQKHEVIKEILSRVTKLDAPYEITSMQNPDGLIGVATLVSTETSCTIISCVSVHGDQWDVWQVNKVVTSEPIIINARAVYGGDFLVIDDPAENDMVCTLLDRDLRKAHILPHSSFDARKLIENNITLIITNPETLTEKARENLSEYPDCYELAETASVYKENPSESNDDAIEAENSSSICHETDFTDTNETLENDVVDHDVCNEDIVASDVCNDVVVAGAECGIKLPQHHVLYADKSSVAEAVLDYTHNNQGCTFQDIYESLYIKLPVSWDVAELRQLCWEMIANKELYLNVNTEVIGDGKTQKHESLYTYEYLEEINDPAISHIALQAITPRIPVLNYYLQQWCIAFQVTLICKTITAILKHWHDIQMIPRSYELLALVGINVTDVSILHGNTITLLVKNPSRNSDYKLSDSIGCICNQILQIASLE